MQVISFARPALHQSKAGLVESKAILARVVDEASHSCVAPAIS